MPSIFWLARSVILRGPPLLADSSIAWFALSQSGTITPERYTHMDGGVYRGNWRGGKKEGLGVYSYPSGARYEGRWEDNLKHGLGVYYFPKAGTLLTSYKHCSRPCKLSFVEDTHEMKSLGQANSLTDVSLILAWHAIIAVWM